ncbi:MAG: UDP-N-acetylmuramoyl-tripeptide--D-alanyl-D-alanine ligase [Planctomycetota bacterium]
MENLFTASQIASACGGWLVRGMPRTAACSVCTDTRDLSPGQAFFALIGDRFDAHDFLPQAAERGASIFVVRRIPDRWQSPPGTAVVRVHDTAAALLSLAAWHRGRLTGRVVAVTGSYGKSTVKNLLGAVLSERGRCAVARASYNNRIGVALTLLDARPSDDYAVLEMGTNHPGEIDELAAAARPEVAIITAVAPVHLEGLGSLEGVQEAKAEIIPHLNGEGTLVLNADHEACVSLAERFGGRVRTFGLTPGADLRATDLRPAADGWRFRAEGVDFHLPFGGRHNVQNAAAALCAARALGVGPQSARGPLAEARPPEMRWERRSVGDVQFVLDCYNSNPPAMRAAARSFLARSGGVRRVIVCGDMLELGKHGPRLHREMGADLAAEGADVLVGVGPLCRHLLDGWRGATDRPGVRFESARDAARPLWRMLRADDRVLLKGSRGMHLERIVDEIGELLETGEAA